MPTVETTVLNEDKVTATSACEVTEGRGWEPSAVVADIATLGTGTLLAGLLNVALVFVVPKLISVEDYGYWRMFGLYAGYVGFLHFGFADGALLRWAGRPLREFRHELRPAIRFLFWQHLAVLVPLSALMVVTFPGPTRFVGIAVAVYAIIFNLLTLLQFCLQSARAFWPMAASTVALPALFLASVLAWGAKWNSDYREVTGLYVTSALIVVLFLLLWTKLWDHSEPQTTMKSLAVDCVRQGWPIVIANTGVMLIIYADRLAASWAAPIQDFAQYSLAGSAMAVPIMAIQACSKVFFSHLAAAPPETRQRIYGIASRMILAAWTVLLPYYFALELFLQRFLPGYLASLRYARVLLLGIPFLASIQILQMSYAYLNGMQRKFLLRTAAVLAVSIGMTSLAAFRGGSLQVVATVQVVLLGAWWLFNEWTLRELTGDTLRDRTKFLVIYGLASSSYWVTTSWAGKHAAAGILLYYAILGALLAALMGREVRIWTSLLWPRSSRQTYAEQGMAGGLD